MKKVLSLLLAVVMVIGMLPLSVMTVGAAETTTLATFTLGDDGSASHVDGSSATTYSETNNGYTLEITSGVKMYTGACDATGNGCIKFGTSSAVGSCSFTVPDDVIEVVISVAKYKAKTSKIEVNGTAYTLNNSSDDGAYDVITVDTTATKIVSFTTVSGYARAMINTIAFNGVASEGAEHVCVWDSGTVTTAATCTTDGLMTYSCTSSDCNEIKTEVIEATGHNYLDGICSNCDEADPNATIDENAVATFRLGENGDATHKDGTESTTYTETVGDYTLDIADGAKMYIGAIDAKGNGSIKLGTSKLVGGFSFTVPANVTEVVVCVAKYKANDTTIDVNGTTYTLTKNSNDGEYDEITVDTTTNKTVTVTTVATTYRAMVNTITFRATGSEGGDTEVCTHTNTTTTTVPATCTEAGSTTVTCADCGETVSTETIEATGHSYTVAGNTATCSCGDSQTISTIAEAKAYTDTTAVYFLKGIVTYVKGTTVYIEDTTGAICVYFTSGTTLDLALGDEILVWDCLTTYNGLIETTYTTAQEYVKVSTGNTLPSQTVTLAQLNADTTNEYLGERVVIENVTMGTINTSGATTLTDADGNTLSIYKVSGLAAEINEGDTVTVTAIVSTFNGYQLLVNPGTAATDVVETVAGEETVVETVSIATAKAGTVGEYYQVEGVVTFIDGKNVYIQDSTGGIVAYLTATNSTAAIGDKVKAYGALKTYSGLIELDGIDQTNTEFFEVLSSGNTVEAQTVTVADLTADTTNEYLAEKVTIENAYISAVGSWSSSYMNVNYTITSGDSSIVIYRAPAATEADVLAVNTIVSLEAIVSTYNGYQLRVVDASKITATAAVCSVNGVPYASMKDALANYTAGSYVKMLADTDEEFTLTADLYIDLSGKTLSGTVDTAGYKIYGMDAATDNYTCDVMGYLACVDANGDDVVPEAMVQTSVTGEARRYLTIATGNGYTFHRFYLGLTHATVKPSTKGVGYKAVFAGDDMVKEKIDSFGYTLQLEGNDAVTCSKAGTEFVSMDTVTLRVDNYDAEKYGEAGLSASVFMTIDGQTVSTSAYTSTLKAMVEKINELTLTDEQKTALAAWIAESAVMQTWNVSNIYTAE